MAKEEFALRIVREDTDTPGSSWQPDFQEPNATSNQLTSRPVMPDSPASEAATETETETSVTQLSAVLFITLGGIAITFALGAIIVLLAAHG